MNTVTKTPTSIAGEHRIVIRGVGWQGYQSLLKMVGDQPVRLTYDRGDVELMSQLPIHELGIYGSLGVPEIWRFNGRDLKVLLRQEDGSYRQNAQSAAFPNVPMAEIERFATMEGFRDQNEWARQFREWVRQDLLPRNPLPGDA